MCSQGGDRSLAEISFGRTGFRAATQVSIQGRRWRRKKEDDKSCATEARRRDTSVCSSGVGRDERKKDVVRLGGILALGGGAPREMDVENDGHSWYFL